MVLKNIAIKIKFLLLLQCFYITSVNALSIQHVELTQSIIESPYNKPAEIRFFLNEEAVVTLKIFDARHYLVYSSEPQLMKKGEQALSWSGIDFNGKRVPPEAYVFTLEAKNASGEAVYDMSDHTGGEKVNHINASWSAKKGVIDLELAKNSRVNLRIGLDQGPVLRTLLDWVPRRGGKYQIFWDGYDVNKAIDLSNHPKLKIVVDAFTLPSNTIYVGPYTFKPEFIRFKQSQIQKRLKKKSLGSVNKHPLAQREASVRRDYLVQLDIDKIQASVIPVKIDVEEAYREALYSSRFEVAVFIDGIYHYENEVAFLPMTYPLDTKFLNKGEHYLTVNIMSYDGNFGFSTQKIIVD